MDHQTLDLVRAIYDVACGLYSIAFVLFLFLVFTVCYTLHVCDTLHRHSDDK
jgi:hypothetical protein